MKNLLLFVIAAILLLGTVLSGCGPLGNLSGSMALGVSTKEASASEDTSPAEMTEEETTEPGEEIPEGSVASVKINEEKTYYDTLCEAWKFANNNTSVEVTVTLLQDVTAVNGRFGDYGNLTVNQRSAALTLDLGGYTINKALTSANAEGTVFCLRNACCLNIKNGTIQGGYDSSHAGGFFIDNRNAELHLENVTVTGNQCNLSGGGLFISGAREVTLTDCEITNNTANDCGGAIATIGNNAVVKLNNVSITGNKTKNNGGGLFVYGSDSEITLNNVTVTENTANFGGGIHWDYTDNGSKMADITMSGTIKVFDNISSAASDDTDMVINAFPDGTSRLTLQNFSNDSLINVKFEGGVSGAITKDLGQDAANYVSCFKTCNGAPIIAKDGFIMISLLENVVATVTTDTDSQTYTSIRAAWNAADSVRGKVVTVTLYQDWIADSNTGLGTGAGFSGGRIDPSNDTNIILDLNQHTIDGGGFEKEAGTGRGLLCIDNGSTETLEIKNGTLRGGNTNRGGCLYLDSQKATVRFTNLNIEENIAKIQGSALFIKNCKEFTLTDSNVRYNYLDNADKANGSFPVAVYENDGDCYLKGVIRIECNYSKKYPNQGNGYYGIGYSNFFIGYVLNTNDMMPQGSMIRVTDYDTHYEFGYYPIMTVFDIVDGDMPLCMMSDPDLSIELRLNHSKIKYWYILSNK